MNVHESLKKLDDLISDVEVLYGEVQKKRGYSPFSSSGVVLDPDRDISSSVTPSGGKSDSTRSSSTSTPLFSSSSTSTSSSGGFAMARNPDVVSQENLDRARERLRERLGESDTVKEFLFSSNLFTSAEALRRKGGGDHTPGDDRFSTLHHGEHEDYNVDKRLAGQIVGGTVGVGGVRGQDGEVVTRVVTTELGREEQDRIEVQGSEKGLVRDDGKLVDSSGSKALLSWGIGAKPRDMFVVTDDGRLLVQDQGSLTRNVDAFRAATKKLEETHGRKVPLSIEEAREFGFPVEVGIGHHTSLTGSEDIRTGGEMVTKDGKVVEVSNASGHYQPHQESTLRAVLLLDDMNGIVHGLGPNSTVVKVFDKDRNVLQLDAIAVLASGGDFARAKLLQRELDSKASPHQETQDRYSEILAGHQDRIAKSLGKLDSGLRKEQTAQILRLDAIDERLKALRGRLDSERVDGEEDPAIELERLVEEQKQAEVSLRELQVRVAKHTAKIAESLVQLEKELKAAGATDDAIALVLDSQRSASVRLNQAQLMFVTWMEDLVKRRKELAALRELAGDDGFQKRKQDAREALTRLFGGGK